MGKNNKVTPESGVSDSGPGSSSQRPPEQAMGAADAVAVSAAGSSNSMTRGAEEVGTTAKRYVMTSHRSKEEAGGGTTLAFSPYLSPSTVDRVSVPCGDDSSSRCSQTNRERD